MKKLFATLTLMLVLGVPFATANIESLHLWFPALKPALSKAIDLVTGYTPAPGPSFKVDYKSYPEGVPLPPLLTPKPFDRCEQATEAQQYEPCACDKSDNSNVRRLDLDT